MTDYRFPSPGVDARFPGGGVDNYFDNGGRFVDGKDLRFEDPGFGVGFPQWIFATGLWADTGFWQDVREWAPAGLFMNDLFWWDTGSWQDAKVW